MTTVEWDRVKTKLGHEAVQRFIPRQGLVGLGSGSTSLACIRALGALLRNARSDYEICAISTSLASKKAALEEGIPLITPEEDWEVPINVTCDGADYIDLASGIAIKGLGGALLREKIVATSSQRVVIMVDERKILHEGTSSKVTIPIEILPFGSLRTQRRLEELLTPYKPSSLLFRRDQEGRFQKTDNGNYTLDVALSIHCTQLSQLHQLISSICGVLETGIFVSVVTDILVGYANGVVQHHIAKKEP